MRTETLMGAAFAKAGVPARNARFNVAIAEFQNNGGTEEQAIELVRAAYRLSWEGHGSGADNGHSKTADPRQPHDAKGQMFPADRANGSVPEASPQASGEGQQVDADKSGVAVPPAREPSQQQRDAVKQAMRQSAMNSFERELTWTGRQWGNVFYRDLDNMLMDADIAQAVKVHIGFLRGEQRYKQIKDLMTPREFAILVNKVRAKHAA